MQFEFDAVKILVEALKRVGVLVFEDGVLDMSIENKGLHRVVCRLYNILDTAFNNMQLNTTLNTYVGHADYDLPLPESALARTKMDRVQQSTLTGGTLFACHNQYRPFQRVLHDLIYREFPQRGFRVKGDQIFQRHSVKPSVLVREEVCRTCGFRGATTATTGARSTRTANGTTCAGSVASAGRATTRWTSTCSSL